MISPSAGWVLVQHSDTVLLSLPGAALSLPWFQLETSEDEQMPGKQGRSLERKG